jgi:hypothetical protein
MTSKSILGGTSGLHEVDGSAKDPRWSRYESNCYIPQCQDIVQRVSRPSLLVVLMQYLESEGLACETNYDCHYDCKFGGGGN